MEFSSTREYAVNWVQVIRDQRSRLIYLDGNSLERLPKAVQKKAKQAMGEQ